MRRGIAWIAGAAVAAVIVVAATRAPRETAPPSPAAPPATEPTDADELRKGTEPGTLVRKGVAMDEAIERFFGAIELSDAESAALVDTGT
ncbi:MAG TPA: hypothetical protein VKA21_13825, partial [Candidatus Binatia bacterium]|nr:hypothetical protein [Candidatus Binatia bacterium]